jgi:hypothetical protein
VSAFRVIDPLPTLRIPLLPISNVRIPTSMIDPEVTVIVVVTKQGSAAGVQRSFAVVACADAGRKRRVLAIRRRAVRPRGMIARFLQAGLTRRGS